MNKRLKIVHVCLRSVYTEGLAYQDNLLPDQNVLDGNEVTVIAGCEQLSDGKIVVTPPEDRLTDSGVRLIRLPMAPLLHPAITQRFSHAIGLEAALTAARPDIVLYHGTAGWDLLTVSRYKRQHPATRLFVDSHEDKHNSGTSFLSLWIQYKLFNNVLVRITKKNVDKYFYISLESRDFLKENYGLDDHEMEFFPLGGIPIEHGAQEALRAEIRRREHLNADALLIVHSGKLTPEKRTVELARAFSRLEDKNACLIIIGSAREDVLHELARLIERDARIRYLGWLPSRELMEYVAAADLYAQPGTQSATLQGAICCGAPVLTYPYPSYKPFVQGNGFFASEEGEIQAALEAIAGDPELVARMSARSRMIASETLSYESIAKKMYS